jgi:uracil-DNA glycosylase
VFLTVHPSFLLRLPTDEAKAAARDEFRRDLVAALSHLDRIRSV